MLQETQALMDGATCPDAAEKFSDERATRLLKNAPMLGKENCYKYLRISLKMNNFTSNDTL